MKQLSIANRIGSGAFVASAFLGSLVFPPRVALADEGGVSFWVPGMFGSLAAVPQQQPGWALATVYYHTSLSAGGDVALAREFEAGRIPANLTASLNANLSATGDFAFVVPSYAFGTPVLGGQAAVSMATIFGRTSTSLAGTLSGSLATPLGSIPFMRSDSISDSVTVSEICTRRRH